MMAAASSHRHRSLRINIAAENALRAWLLTNKRSDDCIRSLSLVLLISGVSSNSSASRLRSATWAKVSGLPCPMKGGTLGSIILVESIIPVTNFTDVEASALTVHKRKRRWIGTVCPD